MVYAVDITEKQQELSETRELAKEASQSFLQLVFGPTILSKSTFLEKEKTPDTLHWFQTIERLKILGQRRLNISLSEANANYDLLGALLDRVRFFVLHRKDLFEDCDREIVVESAFGFFDVATACKNKAVGLYDSASNFIEDGASEELSRLKEKEISLGKDFDHVAKDINYAQHYKRFFSDNNPKYHEKHWTEPEDVPAAYGDHLFQLGNAFTNAAFLEAQRVENLVDYVHLIDKSVSPDEAWKAMFQRMRSGFIREGRPSAETIPKLFSMAHDAYATALKFTSY